MITKFIIIWPAAVCWKDIKVPVTPKQYPVHPSVPTATYSSLTELWRNSNINSNNADVTYKFDSERCVDTDEDFDCQLSFVGMSVLSSSLSLSRATCVCVWKREGERIYMYFYCEHRCTRSSSRADREASWWSSNQVGRWCVRLDVPSEQRSWERRLCPQMDWS